MCTIDLIRHVESDLNADRADLTKPQVIGGRQNEADITDHGVRQAESLGYYALQHDIRPTHFYSSPAKRARLTHTISTTIMGYSVEPIIDDRLQELDQGEWTNQPRTLYDDPIVKAQMEAEGSDFAPPGGESMNQVGDRMWNFLASAALQANVGDHYWVSGHGVAIKTVLARLLGWTHEQTWRCQIDNASLTRLLVYDDYSFEVAFINQDTSSGLTTSTANA